MATEFKSAMTTRSLRMVRTELEFLADAAVITPQQLSTILAQLPVEPNARSLGQTQQPAPTPSPLPVPVQAQPPPTSYGPLVSEPASAPINEKLPIRNQYAPPPQSPPGYTQSPPVLSIAEALYDYKTDDPRDLSLLREDRVQVYEHMNNDWWRGRNMRTGQEGIFPRIYVNVTNQQAPLAPVPPTNYGNMPLEVSQSGSAPSPSEPGKQSKFEEGGKKFGKKLGNAAIFGAGATVGSNIVNSIF